MGRIRDRFIRKEPETVTLQEDMSLHEKVGRLRRGEKIETQKVVEPDEGGFINRIRRQRRDKAKEKAMDDGAFFGMRADGKMIDGWPIK